MHTDVTERDAERQAEFEWYLIESSRSTLSPLTRRSTKFGPFTTEAECRAVLASAEKLPRFRNSVFEIHKRRERRDHRFKIEYPVRLCQSGTDQTIQLARTIDVSVSGACLGSLTNRLTPGQVFSLHCAGRTAPFQVVWVGSGTSEDRAGLRCLAPEVNIWNLDALELTPEQRLPRDIDRARAVQHRLFLQEMPHLRTLDYSAHCIQARTVGGDYYDFVPFAPGDVGLVVADVSGKGIAAALLMANLHGAACTRSVLSARGIRCVCSPR